MKFMSGNKGARWWYKDTLIDGVGIDISRVHDFMLTSDMMWNSRSIFPVENKFTVTASIAPTALDRSSKTAHAPSTIRRTIHAVTQSGLTNNRRVHHYGYTSSWSARSSFRLLMYLCAIKSKRNIRDLKGHVHLESLKIDIFFNLVFLCHFFSRIC